MPHLHWHQDRLNRSQEALFEDFEHIDLNRQIAVPEKLRGLWKCRVLYAGHLERIEFEVYRRRLVRSLRLMEADDLDYRWKWVDRRVLDALFGRRSSADDVLIVKNGLITDTSYANVACWDGRHWWTPARPLLPGTCRARLLHAGRLRLADIPVSEISSFQKLRIFNAMTGWSGAWEIKTDRVF